METAARWFCNATLLDPQRAHRFCGYLLFSLGYSIAATTTISFGPGSWSVGEFLYIEAFFILWARFILLPIDWWGEWRTETWIMIGAVSGVFFGMIDNTIHWNRA